MRSFLSPLSYVKFDLALFMDSIRSFYVSGLVGYAVLMGRIAGGNFWHIRSCSGNERWGMLGK